MPPDCIYISKMQKEKNELKRSLLSKKEPEFKDLGDSQCVNIAKNEKACSEEYPKGVAPQPFDNEIAYV